MGLVKKKARTQYIDAGVRVKEFRRLCSQFRFFFTRTEQINEARTAFVILYSIVVGEHRIHSQHTFFIILRRIIKGTIFTPMRVTRKKKRAY